MKYHSLFLSKISKGVTKFVVCCSRDWRFKGYCMKWACICSLTKAVSLVRTLTVETFKALLTVSLSLHQDSLPIIALDTKLTAILYWTFGTNKL